MRRTFGSLLLQIGLGEYVQLAAKAITDEEIMKDVKHVVNELKLPFKVKSLKITSEKEVSVVDKVIFFGQQMNYTHPNVLYILFSQMIVCSFPFHVLLSKKTRRIRRRHVGLVVTSKSITLLLHGD